MGDEREDVAAELRPGAGGARSAPVGAAPEPAPPARARPRPGGRRPRPPRSRRPRRPTRPRSTRPGARRATAAARPPSASSAAPSAACSAARFEAQRTWNAHQVRLDNELLRYLEERFAATHRHYDRLLGAAGPAPRRGRRAARPPRRRSSSPTCRTSCAGSTSSSAEYEPRPARARSSSSRTCARGSRGSRRRCGGGHEDRPRVRRPGALRHGGRRDPRPRAGLAPRPARLPGGRGGAALPRPPALRAGAPGARLAPPRAAGDERPRGRPRDPHEVPVLSRAAPRARSPGSSTSTARPTTSSARRSAPSPTGPRTGACARPIHAMDAAALGRVPAPSSPSPATWRSAWPASTGSPGTPLYPPPRDPGRYRTDGYGDYLFYAGRLERIKRVDLALRALAASTERGPAEDRRAGLPRGRPAPPRRDARRRRTAWTSSASSPPRTSSPSMPAAARPGTRRSGRGLRLRDGRELPLPQARRHLDRRRAARSSSSTDGVSGVVAAPEPQALADAIDRLFAAARGARCARWARRGARAVEHRVGHGRGPPDGDAAVRLALWTPPPRRGVGRGARAAPRAGGARSRSWPDGRARREAEPRSLPRRRRPRARLRAPRPAPAARRRAPRRLGPAPPRARRGRGAGRRGAYLRRGPSRPRDDGRLRRAAGGARARRRCCPRCWR